MSDGFCFLAGVGVEGHAETVTIWSNSESVVGVMFASIEIFLFGAWTCAYLDWSPSHCKS